MKKKITLMLTLFVLGVLVSGTLVMASNTFDSELVEEELFPSEEIEAPNEESELYVELNNQLVNAINDYNNGTITEEEYIEICNEISSKVDFEDEMSELQQSEEAYFEGE